MDHSLRIGVIGVRGFSSNYSGIERVAQSLYPELGKRGHRVVVYSRVLEPKSPTPGVSVKRCPALPLRCGETLSHSLFSAWDVNFRSYDVVHLHALAPALLCWSFQLCKTPTVVTVHGLDWERARWRGAGKQVLRISEQMAVRFAEEIIVVSQELQDYYRTTWGRATTLIYNSVEFEQSRDSDGEQCVRELGLVPNTYLLYAGRLVPEKRIADIISAVRQVPGGCHLAIAGDGDRDYLDYLKRVTGGDPRIRFLGHHSQFAVRNLMRHSMAFISASELEGFSVALLEAVAEMAPAIVSNIASHIELFSSYPSYDLFFPKGDVKALCDRIRSVMDKPNEFRCRALKIRTLIAHRLPIEKMINQTENVLISASRQRANRGKRNGDKLYQNG